MKVLITGGAGFIGYHLAKELAAKNYEVVVVDNFSRGVEDRFLQQMVKKNSVKMIPIDLMDEAKVMGLGDDFSYIYHLAAIIGVQNVLNHPYDVLEKNVQLLMNLIQLGKRQKRMKRFVFASTSEVYAGTLQFFNMEIPTPETTPLAITPLEHPRTSYMLSKIYGEALLQHSGLPFTIVRPHNVYGPRMGMSHVIPELLQKAYMAAEGEKLEVFSVDHKRTFCYISDAVKMIRLLAESETACGESYNIGNESPEVTIRTVAETVLKATGKELAISAKPATAGSPVRRCPSMEKTKTCIGFAGEVSLEDGINRTFAWYKQYVFSGSERCAK